MQGSKEEYLEVHRVDDPFEDGTLVELFFLDELEEAKEFADSEFEKTGKYHKVVDPDDMVVYSADDIPF